MCAKAKKTAPPGGVGNAVDIWSWLKREIVAVCGDEAEALEQLTEDKWDDLVQEVIDRFEAELPDWVEGWLEELEAEEEGGEDE